MLFAQVRLPTSRTLLLTTVLYTGLPYLAFFLGWLKWYISLPACALLIVCYWLTQRRTRPDLDERLVTGSVASLVAVTLLLACWLIGSGVGGLVYQNGDYIKHNAMLDDLIAHPWPVTYEIDAAPGSRIHLVYYMAYYLPAALFGKFAGVAAARAFMFPWSFVGLALAACWIFRFLGRISIWPIVAFIFFSGLDYWGYLWTRGEFPALGDHLEWWLAGWQFSSPTTQLYWVPQHALAGWTLTGAVVSEWQRGRSDHLGLLACLAVLWSPFVALGLLLLAVCGTVGFQFSSRKWFNFPNIAGSLLIGGIGALFLFAKLPDQFGELLLTGEAMRNMGHWLLAFLLLELGVYLLPLAAAPNTLVGRFRVLFWVSVITLPFQLIYRYGYFNDLAMRLSLPFLFIFFLGVAQCWQRMEQRWLRLALVLFWILGALSPLQEIARACLYPCPTKAAPVTVLGFDSNLFRQYMARRKSLFYDHFARRADALPVHVDEATLRIAREEGLITN